MSAITNATDADLRQLVYKREHVIVKFIDKECEICKELAPSFEELAELPQYKDVLFLRMDAKENPVSLQEVRYSRSPFMATYKKGVLLDCGSVSTQEEITDLLSRLLQ